MPITKASWCIAFAKLHGKRQVRDSSPRLDASKFKQDLLKATWVRNNQPPQLYKPKTINHAIISLRRAFNWAIDNELPPEGRNPFARLKLVLGDTFTRPVERHSHLLGLPLHFQHDALQQQPHDPLSIQGCRRFSIPEIRNVYFQRPNLLLLLGGQPGWLGATELLVLLLNSLLLVQRLFPTAFQLTGDQAVFGFDLLVLTGRTLSPGS